MHGEGLLSFPEGTVLMPNPTLTMPLVEWDSLVGRVALFAAPPRDPGAILSAVHLYSVDGRLYAEATDRYRIGSAVAPESVVAPKGFAALLSVESIADLARITKVPARLRGSLNISLTPEKGNRLVVSIEALPGLGDVALSLQLVDGDYPPIGKILHEALSNADAPEASAFNPDFLADYRKVSRRGEPVLITPHGNKPAAIRIGDDFVGALVPLRHPERPTQTDDSLWAHLAPTA